WLTTQRKAWDVLSDFCSAMRCMPVWNGQTLTFVQDRPSDKVCAKGQYNWNTGYGGAELGLSYPITKHVRLYTQVYSGYGESLI
ncbi:phospholipase A, partial [Escherichia coli]|uniref:phospholipase A n=1 Tax=Escherichia coli TaxID=562 RepID=UPI00207791C8